jgi:tight adherence protein C
MSLDGTLVAVSGLLLAALVAAGAAMMAFVRREGAVERRLKSATEAAPVMAAEAPPVFIKGLEPFARVAQPMSEEALSALGLRMTRAGHPRPVALQVFLATKVLLGLGLTSAFLWYNSTLVQPFEPAALLAVLAFGVGYYLPELWLRSEVADRQRDIERALPDTLDLLVTCVEAGLGLDAAMQRVAAETKRAWPVLGDELELTYLEVKAGIPRVDAFRRLAHRTGVGEVKMLAATLRQTEIFGTSVGTALRVQAEGIRIRHTQRAEEKAGYASVRMTLPLTACILPAIFAVVAGPAILRIMTAFSQGLGK